MSRRRHRYPAETPFVRVPRRVPRQVSIAELKWNARLGVVSQLVWLAGQVPRRLRLVAALALAVGVWLVLELTVAWWPYLLAALVLAVVYRVGRPRLEAWQQYRRDRDSVPF